MMKAVILFIALCFVASIAAAPQGSVCDTCQVVVTQLENYVNQTEPELEKQLVKACAQLPAQLEGLCDTIVLVYGHQIIQSLLKKETPQVICQQIRLCPKNNTVVAEKPAMPNDLQCTLCKLLVQAAESFISQNKTEQQILDGLHKVCDALPSFWKDQCKALVDQYTPQIIEYLKQKYPAEQICQKISLCKKAVELEPKVEVTNDYCDLCQQVASWLENYVEDNRTSEKIIEALTKVCNYTGQYESMCKAMLPVVWAQLVKKLHDQEPPAVICKQLHMCAAKKVVAPKVSNAQLCNGCKYLVAVADNFVTKNSTEQHIVQTVEKVCEYFPASYKGVCQAVVEQYGPQIVEQLVQKVLDPTKVCTAVKACPKQAPKAEEIVAAHGFKIKMN